MMRPLSFLRYLAVAAALLWSAEMSAQFKSEAFRQTYNDDQASKDSTDTMFSFKEYFGGLTHKNEIKIGTSFAGACVFVGGQQIYNRQYWKLPIVYGGILGAAGAGAYFNSQQKPERALYCFAGAGVCYWATLLDGVVSYKPSDFPHPGKATLYSILLPGLGQAYNNEYWKIPIYVGGLACSYYFYHTNSVSYERFRRIYREATNPDVPYTGPISAETALYYRDAYRRLRDYSVLAIGLVYLLQVMDANVFSYMHNFEVSDDFTMDVSPAVITPSASANQFASGVAPTALGVRFGFTF